MAPQKRLSEVPEGASLRCHFNFALIGPGSWALAENVIKCPLHSEVSEVVTMCNVADRAGQEAKPAWDALEEEQGVHKQKKKEELGIYCMLDEDDLQIAKVRLKPVETFSDSLNDMKIGAGEFRHACFIYLMDQRKDLAEDILPLLDQALAEMNFMFNAARMKGSGKKLRAFLLLHQPCMGETVASEWDDSLFASVSPSQAAGGTVSIAATAEEYQEGPEVAAFAKKLQEVAKAGHPRHVQRKVDLDDHDAVFEALQRIAREMFRANTSKKGMSSVFRSMSFNDDPKRRCCIVQ